MMTLENLINPPLVITCVFSGKYIKMPTNSNLTSRNEPLCISQSFRTIIYLTPWGLMSFQQACKSFK